jgi:hypothetical protein
MRTDVRPPESKSALCGTATVSEGSAGRQNHPSRLAFEAKLLCRSTEDRTINPDLERFMAKRMGAKTVEVKAGHLSLITHPDEITALILEAASGPGAPY